MAQTEITEDYVSFETAQLLKQKGFDVPIRTFYNPKYRGEKVSDGTALINYNADPEDGSVLCSAPTLQMACKWLRHKGMCININVNEREICDTNGNHKSMYHYWRYDVCNTTDGVYIYEDNKECQLYEEAMDAAIQYCLTNIID